MSKVEHFETSSMLITIVLLGKFLEVWSKKQTIERLEHLASLKETKAILLTKGKDHDETEIEIDFL